MTFAHDNELSMLITNETLNSFTHLRNKTYHRKKKPLCLFRQWWCLQPVASIFYTLVHNSEKIHIYLLNFFRYYLKYISFTNRVNRPAIIIPHNYDNFKDLLAKVRVAKLTSSRGPLISLVDRHCYFSGAGRHVYTHICPPTLLYCNTIHIYIHTNIYTYIWSVSACKPSRSYFFEFS